jgi:hypothetical protein
MQTRVIQGSFPQGLNHLSAAMQRESGGVVQRLSASGGAVSLPPRLASFPIVGGQPLAPEVRQKMETLFGANFADVRVHVGPHAASIGAHAFTHGSDIHFAPGRFATNTTQGQQALAHELAHVVQQRTGRARNPFPNGIAVVHDASLEAEAERYAHRAGLPAPAVQRATGVQQANARPAPRHNAVQQRMTAPVAARRVPPPPFAHPRAPFRPGQTVQPFFGLFEAGVAAAAVGAGYALYHGARKAYDYYQWYYAPELQERSGHAYHAERDAFTDYDEGTDPYLMRASSYRQFDLVEQPNDFVLEPVSRPDRSGKYAATDVSIGRIRLPRQRMVTGHRGKTNPQGHHLFSFEALMNGMESFNGSLQNLITIIRKHFLEYQSLPNQNEQTLILLRQSTESLDNMQRTRLTIDAWQRIITHLLQSYVQIQQWSAHATSGHGSGPQGEGAHIEALRTIELKLESARISAFAAADEARNHMEALFDLHGSIRRDYRVQSVSEGTDWLKHTYPLTLDAYQKRYKFL